MSAFFAINGVSKRFRGLLAVDRVSCEVADNPLQNTSTAFRLVNTTHPYS